MNIYEILLFLEGLTEESAKKHLKEMGVSKSLHKHILGCYDKNRRLIKTFSYKYLVKSRG